MNPAQLSDAIVQALTDLVEAGDLTLPDGVPSSVTVERPRQKGHGDYATNVAMQLAKKAGTNPRALGELLAARLREDPGVREIEVAGPGFLNVTVEAGAQGKVAADVVAAWVMPSGSGLEPSSDELGRAAAQSLSDTAARAA